MTWTWVAETVDGRPLGELTEARGRKVTVDLRGPATCEFTLDGRSDQARELEELRTDLFAWRDREPVFRGRLGSTDDDLDADRHTVSFSAVDYRGILGARHDLTGRVYDGWWQDDIGWNLVQVAQSWDGGPLGITRGPSRAAPVQRTEVIDVDTPIDEALDRFQDYAQGFEWWIDAGLQYQAATWRGAWRPDLPIEWGTAATKLKRAYDTGAFANWIRVRGGRPEGVSMEEPEPVADRWAPDLATRPEGRIGRIVQNFDLKDQAAVDAYAEQLLADTLVVPSAYTANLTPGLWRGPSHIWVGDTLPVVVRSGRLDVARVGRVAVLAITIDEEGEEQVEVTFGHA